jgi:hypothetical protein
VYNLDVDILTVVDLDVDILTIGDMGFDRRTWHLVDSVPSGVGMQTLTSL